MKSPTNPNYWHHYVLSADPWEVAAVIKEEWITSQNLRIHLDIYEPSAPRETTILFVHGTSVYSRFYAEFCYNLYQKGYRIVAPDLIGHGRSEGARGHFTMTKFVATIHDVTSYILDTYDGTVVVMGSSLGGITALYCAAADSRLQGAICHNAAVFNEQAYKWIVQVKGILKVLLPLIPSFSHLLPKLRLHTKIYLDWKALGKTPAGLQAIDEFLLDPLGALKYTLTSLRTQMREPLAQSLEQITVPVMIINGTDDVLFPVGQMQAYFDRLQCPYKSLEILEGASHLILQEHIPETLERILPWLDSIS
ncbi:MAG TPA: alpha/beta fold hydrolase [Candidatus Lokiarchaeia archaeon]|nr:alpha/beta fold hydrolase [Candidatus Lokiarchaeia archaeon]